MSIALHQRIKELEALVAELCLRVAELEKKPERKTMSLPKKDPA
jgi:hypothetical protein